MMMGDEFLEKGFYTTPAGLIVFNEEYLLSRGYCCGNGCKHCPYEYKNVEEPRRTKLLDKRKENDENKKGKP